MRRLGVLVGTVATALCLGGVLASGAGAQMFTQCPPAGADKGCQYLITLSSQAPTVQNDASQGPYEASDDSLIGVQNNSSAAVASLPLSSPGLFSFEQDGICNPGPSGPPAPGCASPPGGQPCGAQNNTCSFPPPPGQPAGYTEPGAPSGTTQNGYEGPTTWFSNVSPDTNSGQVNFSPALAPGASTYFSLEAPPSASGLQVGTPTPAAPPPAPPTAFGKNGLISAPSNKTCVSRRNFRIRLRKRKGLAILAGTVKVNGKLVATRKGTRVTAPVNLTGLPKGRFTVAITVLLSDGRIVKGTRKYRTCTKKQRGGRPKL
jgi:hypothetical protein